MLEFKELLKIKKKKKKEVVNNVIEVKDDGGDYTYTDLLNRIYQQLPKSNQSKKKSTLPRPIIVRVGTKRVMWSNFNQICLGYISHSFSFFPSFYIYAVCII